MYKIIESLFLIFLFASCASVPHTQTLDHPDSGFKYRTSIQRANKTTKRGFKLYMESLPESVLENRKLRSYYLAEYKEYNDILTEVIFYISDAYTISPIDSIADIIDTPPLFKNKGDEKIFSQWVLKKNEIKFPPNFTKLDVDHRGHLVLEVTINKNGELDLKVLKVKDTSSIDKYISNELIYTLKQSPRWKSGIHVGEIVDSKYIVSIVWGHYRGMGKSGGAYKTFDISGKMNINTFKVNGL